MADANRLTTKVTSYTVFEENQVLSSEQLNQLTDYLDRQLRLTRTRLIGVGIVCGLELQMTSGSVILGKGVALTTDGDLLEQSAAQKFTRFRKFSDEDAKYPQFRPEEKLLPLFELVEKDGVPLSNFSAETGLELSKMVALLYLEAYFYDPDLCTGSGCDNLGKEARNNLRVLLIEAENAKVLLGDQALLGRRYPLLESYRLPRVILDPDKIDDYAALGNQYRNVIDSAIPTLKAQLQKTWQPLIRPLLEDLYGKTDPTQNWGQILDDWQAKVRSSLSAVQYLYAFLHDLAQAYAEFKEALFADNVLCVPPVELFPKHLLLGGVGELAVLRHGFYASPQLNRQDAAIARVRFFHQRLDRMISLFRLPATTTSIRITPSRSKCVELGGRAVPYYYQPDKKQPLTGNWSFAASQRGLQSGIYSYYAAELGGTAEARAPLKFDLYGQDFFRIEGHLGGNVDTVEKELKKQIEDFNLPIQILTLQIETALPPIRIRPLGPLRDLKVMHRLYRQDLLLNLGNIRTFTAKVKETVDKADELPGKDVEAETLSYKAFIDDSSKELDQSISKLSTGLKVDYNQFKLNDFKLDYQSTVQKAAGINKSVRGVTYRSAFTPYESLLNDSKFKYLGWIEDILNKRRQRAEELSVFARFLQEAPALEHLGGVPKGGTFILVFSASSKQVLADFCLPYWHVDVPEAEEPEDKAVEETDLKWIDFNDFLVKRNDTKVLTEQVKNLKETFGGLDLRLRSQEDTLRIYSGSLKTYTDTVFETKGKTTDAQRLFGDRELGAQAGMLEMLGIYMEQIDKKADEGIVTPDETKMRKKMEAMSGEIINHTVKTFQEKGRDILPNSEEEKFMETAIATSTRIKDRTEKQKLSDNMLAIQGNAGDKIYMSNMLNNLIKR